MTQYDLEQIGSFLSENAMAVGISRSKNLADIMQDIFDIIHDVNR